LSYKKEIFNTIANSSDVNQKILDINQKTYSHYNDDKIFYQEKMSRFFMIFREKINTVLDWKKWKLIWKYKYKIDELINSPYRDFYKHSKNILKNSQLDNKEINDHNLYIGQSIYIDISRKKLQISELNNIQKTILLNYLISNFKSRKPSVYLNELVSLFYNDNVEKKYEILDNLIKWLNSDSSYDKDTLRLEEYFSIFNLHDSKRNYFLLKKLIISTEGNVNLEYLWRDFFTIQENSLNIINTLFSFLKFDIVAKNFDIFNIKSEEDRFKIAKMLLKKWDLLWKNFIKFWITKPEYVKEIYEHLWQNSNWFINYYNNFTLSNEEKNTFFKNTIKPDTILDLKYFKVVSLSEFLEIWKILFLKTIVLETNLERYLTYANNNFWDSKLEIFDFLSKQLISKPNEINVFYSIKLLYSNKLFSKEDLLKFKTIFFKNFIRINWVVWWIKTLMKIKLDNNDFFYYLKSDIIFLLRILLELKLIDDEVYKAIISENDWFDNIKNFIVLLFTKSQESPIIHTDYDFYKWKNADKDLSRKLFFKNLNINFPTNNIKYDSSKIQQLYSYAYKCSDFYSDNLFLNISIDNDLFLKHNIDYLIEYFKNLSLLSNISDIFWAINKFYYNSYLMKLDFKQIITELEINFDFKDIYFTSKINLDNIWHVNIFLKNFLIEIFSKNFNWIDLKLSEFENLIKKWGDIDSIISLISYNINGNEFLEILWRIIKSDSSDNFLNYKYNWFKDSIIDIDEAKAQIWFLDNYQKDIWMNNELCITKVDNRNNYSSVETNYKNDIYTSLILNKHLDSYKSNYSAVVYSKINSNKTKDLFNQIISSKHHSSIIEYILKDFDKNIDYLISSLFLAEDNLNIIKIIRIIKEVFNQKNIDLWVLLNEFNSYLKNIWELNKLNNPRENSYFFTIESDNPKILLEVWDLVNWDYSCQSFKNNSSSLCSLPGYVVDAWIKVLLTFEINESTFNQSTDFIEFEKIISSWEYNILFNPYKKELKLWWLVITLNKAVCRNIMKLWQNQYNKTPNIFLERDYKSISWNKLEQVRRIHKKILQQKILNIKWSEIDKNTIFKKSRNIFWVYCDLNNKIEKYDYKIESI